MLFISSSETDDGSYKTLCSASPSCGPKASDYVKCKNIIEDRYHKFKAYLDSDAATQIKAHFNSVYWELLLCEFLTYNNVSLSEKKKKGPDFKCSLGDLDFYIEAISLTAGKGLNSAEITYTETPVSQTYDPTKLQLRITQGITDKSKKMKTYLAEGLVPSSHPLIIGLHHPNLGFDGHNGIPAVVNCVFPSGQKKVRFPNNGDPPDVVWTHETTIEKHNGTTIDKAIFLSDEFKHISAILFSKCTYPNEDRMEYPLGISLVHNPKATHPFPQNLLPCPEWLPMIYPDRYEIKMI